MKTIFIVFIILTLIGPIWVFLTDNIEFGADYLTANRESSHLTPEAHVISDAVIQVYAARAFNWRGIFALHTWIAVKPKNAKQYTVYQIIGWRYFRNLPALSIEADIPDRIWFNQKPKIIYEIRGVNAEKLIPKINEAANRYPYANNYVTWPGPNSNTFVAYIARAIPEMKLALPSNAIGKDFTGNHILIRAPSGTGYQLTIFGCFGIMLALKEGFEINLLGFVYGISPAMLTIKLPAIGDISFKGHIF